MKKLLLFSLSATLGALAARGQIDSAVKATPLPEVSPTQEASSLKTMQAALTYRAELASSLAKGGEKVQSALDRLRTRTEASGLGLSGEADFGHAALDVGHRLIALKRADLAEVFFSAAEEAFAQVVTQAGERTQQKAEYLQKLAFVRAKYLNKAALARANIDEAIRLEPENKTLQETRVQLARGQGEIFKSANDSAVKN